MQHGAYHEDAGALSSAETGPIKNYCKKEEAGKEAFLLIVMRPFL